MKIESLKKMDRIIKDAGSRNPDDILSAMGFIYMDPGGSLPGFIARRKGIIYYGVNKKFGKQKYTFGSFHEAFHGICGHLSLPGFLKEGAHADSFLNSRIVAATERDANIGAADALIDTETFLEMSGFYSADVRSYLASLASFEQAAEDYRKHLEVAIQANSPESRIRRMMAHQEELSRMYEQLQEQASDITYSRHCLSRPEMAQELDVPEYVIDYKAEAMYIRNYNIPKMELPSYEKVFKKWQGGSA